MDKFYHAVVCYALTLTFCIVLNNSWAAAIAFVIGILKEIRDGKNNTWSEHFKDMLANLAGICSGLVLLWVFKR